MILHKFKMYFKTSPTQRIIKYIMCKVYVYNTFETRR
jgi:hypothetical protein